MQELGIDPGNVSEFNLAIELARRNRNDGVGTTRVGGPRNTFNPNRGSYTSGKNKGALPSENQRGGATNALKGIKRHGFE